MATKQELIARLEDALAKEDPEQQTELVDTTKEAYEALVVASQQADPPETPEGASENGHDNAVDGGQVPIENAAAHDDEDRKFKQLLDTFNQKVNELHRQRAKAEEDNLTLKQAIMEELRQLISQEDKIGSAFQRFGELQEKWKSVGPVPHNAYRDLQRDFSQLRDEFFYHIRIYKELRDHDLRKNTALKLALIADMESVVKVDSVHQAEVLVKEYQERWHLIGPVEREEWEGIRDRFWNATRAVYERIHEHYKARRAEREANLEAKQVLVEKVKALTTQTEGAGTREWKAQTDQVLELQAAWKTIGFATRKDNEKVWREFRDACNVFFDARKQHFDKIKDQFKAVRDAKQALIDKAQALKDSTDWRDTAEALKRLQVQWKNAGSASHRDEQRLWSKFRETCDAFFQARKAHFDQLDAELADNVKARESLVLEIEGFALGGDRDTDIAALRSFSQRWLQGGRVPPGQYDALFARYKTGLDKLYGQMKMEVTERKAIQFQDHINGIKAGPDARLQLERESRVVKRKIEELESEIRQFDDRMGMFNFKSASGEKMKKDMERTLERNKEEVQRLKAQHRQLTMELR